jgi:hypothetical protein
MSKPRILVFEADAAINQSIRDVLEAAGYAVSQAFDCPAAGALAGSVCISVDARTSRANSARRRDGSDGVLS